MKVTPTQSPSFTSREKAKAVKRPARLVQPDNLLRLASLIVLLSIWELYGRALNPVLFTYPSAIAREAATMLLEVEFWTYFFSSLRVFAQGLVLAMFLGIPFGIIMARVHLIDTILRIYVNALYVMPIVAIVPLLVLWFGFSALAKTVIVFLFTIFPLILNTYQGVKNVDQDLLEVARSFCSSELRLWRDCIVPSALPYILVGLRLAIGRGLVGMVIADFYTAISGIGYLIVQYANSFQTAKLFVPIVVLIVLGTVLNELLNTLEKRLTPWRSRGGIYE